MKQPLIGTGMPVKPDGMVKAGRFKGAATLCIMGRQMEVHEPHV